MFSGTTQSHPVKQHTARKVIAETLLQELEFQIRESQNYARDVEKQKTADSGRPDYTWLMDTPKSYRVPPVVRTEIEELSKYLDVDEVSTIIKEFRDAIDYDIAVDKMVNYLKFIINHHVQEKRKTNNLEEYKRLQLTPNYESPVRSKSSAVIKQIKATATVRPQSAPLSSAWKKRTKVHPVNRTAYKENKSHCIYINLEGGVSQENEENSFVQENSTENSFV